VKQVAFKTVGCRLNQAETALMTAAFEKAGCRVVPFGAAADICVINTCTVTANAERECVRIARSVRRRNPAARVVLAGCAVQVHRDRLREACAADLLVGQADKFRIPELLGIDGPTGAERAADVPEPLTPRFETTRALVRVQDGCSFRCAYCIVPDARGEPRGRKCSDVLDEVRRLADSGHREIVVTGANLGCFRDGRHALVDLLEKIEGVDGVDRIRLSSIELTTTERSVIDYMAHSRKLCHFLHLPLQSGDDAILSAMRRRYRSQEYRATVEYALAAIPRLGLGTDVLVGFPGETEESFAVTRAFIESLPFSNLHVFPYSPRPGTPAAAMPDQVPVSVKRARVAELIDVGRHKRAAFARTLLGQPVRVLLERVERDIARGWCDEYIEVRVRGRRLAVNDLLTLRPSSLDGDVLTATGGDDS
jgi:threonylcarbamoyladenosine tRNA methylthiotransferase MtaB